MPPSPSLRRCPRGDPRNDSRKRGRSLESGLSFKEKDDDLALFNEMQSKERENFLLESTDDFEDLLSSKMKPFPGLKLAINIPARGESSDLLNADGDKNDYEWLLTPPETPLFASLDDEPAPVNLVHSGRARSRPISLSRSSTMERSQRSSRGSPSPQRLSPSPRSGTGTFQGRPSSAPQSGPVPLRPSTPSQRPSPPPVKPSTPPPRSLTPTSRRTTPGFSGSLGRSGTRGTSPIRTSRGNSSSPKVKAWQSNIPGFSLEAPPNLRTSLADRPASYVRGSSPASRTSRDSSSNFGRQSMSPTPRSISSSHSQERDRLSSHSKGSVASSGDDDADSLQSAPVSISERPMSRKGVSGYPSGRPSVYSKKSAKTFCPSSAPKRSFDSAMRQMDRRSPQNMFRPLLSSVPSSTFYPGKASSTHRTMISRNSSVTTSSNASSDQATSGAHDTEGSDQYHDDMASDCARASFSDIHDEVFAFDKMDVEPQHIEHEGHDSLSESQLFEADKKSPLISNTGDSEASNCAVKSGASGVQGEFGIIDSHEIALVCSRCGSHYLPDELAENEDSICPECKQKEELVRISDLIRLETSQDNSVPLMDILEELHVPQPKLDAPQSKKAMGDAQSSNVSQIGPHEVDSPESRHLESQPSQSYLDISSVSITAESTLAHSKQQVAREHTTPNDPSYTDDISGAIQKSSDKTDMNIDIVERAGISLLLNRSSSVKGPIIHGRTLNSSPISYEDLTYARDLTSSMKSSIGHGSVSTSSSIDFTSARHGEMLVHRQLSCKLSDSSSKPQSTVTSLSGTSMLVYQGLGLSTSSCEGSFEGSVSNTRHTVSGDRPTSPSDEVVSLENIDSDKAVPSGSRAPMIQEDGNVYMRSSEIDPSLMAGYMLSTEVQDRSQASLDIRENHLLHEIDENSRKCEESPRTGESKLIASSLARDGIVLDNRVGQLETAEDLPQCSSSTMSVIEINDSHPSSPRSQIDVVSRDDLEDPSATLHHHTDVKDTSPGSVQADPDRTIEESTVTMVDQGERRTRSLTLEEATDTILFCSSIIHDLAYKAANIAIEKEKENLEPSEGSRLTVTIPDKCISDRQDQRGFNVGRTAKPQKARKRRTSDSEGKPPLTENDERSKEPVVRNVGLPNKGDSMNPTKLESKCNCTIM